MTAVAFLLSLALQDAQDPDARRAAELVEQLRSDSIEKREEAARGLRALGVKALPAVERATRDPDREVAGRARRILQLIPMERRTETVKIPGMKVSFGLTEIRAGHAGVRYDADPTGARKDPREFDLKPFWLGTFEVTWQEFLLYYDERRDPTRPVDGVTRPSRFVEFFGPMEIMHEPGFPVTCLRWHSAIEYCAWLSRKTGDYYRLPTEAEWETACRSGLEGDTFDAVADCAWHRGNSDKGPHRPGLKEPNRLGLHDMLGNVREYCLEPYRPGTFGPVLRGGGWTSPLEELTFVARDPIHRDWSERDPDRPLSLWQLTDGPFVGIRVARVPGSAREAAREEYSRKIAIRIRGIQDLKDDAKKMQNYFVRVLGELENLGDRTIEELELAVYPIDAKGRPRWVDEGDRAGRPLFNRCYPVLPNSAWSGDQSGALAPKARRTFSVDIPVTFDDDPVLEPRRFGARVTALCLRE